MFEFTTSEYRDRARLGRWQQHMGPKVGKAVYRFWWVLHNSVAHPILGIFPVEKAFHFHDWTSDRLNKGYEEDWADLVKPYIEGALETLSVVMLIGDRIVQEIKEEIRKVKL